MRETHLSTLDIQDNRSRSISPLGIARCRELLSDLSRRFSRRSHDGVIYTSDDNDAEFGRKSSSLQNSHKEEFNSNLELYRSSSEENNSSDCENIDLPIRNQHIRSSSAVRVLRLDSTSSSKSSYSTGGNTSNKKDQSSQKKILRQPVSYTYLKGMSGLPTQRVPRSLVCSQYSCRRRFLV